jgi:hypothetical protein
MHYRLLEQRHVAHQIEDEGKCYVADVVFGVTMFALCVWGACVMVP